MGRWLWLVAGGCTATDEVGTDSSPTGTVDTTGDTDDTPTADTADTTPSPESSWIRVVHAAAGRTAQDMVVNDGLPPALAALSYGDGTDYSPRPPAVYRFQFKDTGTSAAQAWTTFDEELLVGRRHSFVIYGTPKAPSVLRVLDADLDIDPAKVRIRWTHVAPALPPSVDLYDLAGGTTLLHADLAYGASVELDHDPVTMQLGVDVDDDAAPDLVFQTFDRDGGEYFHVMLVTEQDGTPYLLAQTEAGGTPRRDLVVGN